MCVLGWEFTWAENYHLSRFFNCWQHDRCLTFHSPVGPASLAPDPLLHNHLFIYFFCPVFLCALTSNEKLLGKRKRKHSSTSTVFSVNRQSVLDKYCSLIKRLLRQTLKFPMEGGDIALGKTNFLRKLLTGGDMLL